jgi:hypothetical protein
MMILAILDVVMPVKDLLFPTKKVLLIQRIFVGTLDD